MTNTQIAGTGKWVVGAGSLLLVSLASAAAPLPTIAFNGELDLYLSNYQAAGAESDSTSGIESNGMTTSWLGVSGEQIINDDLKAIAALEMFLRPDSAESGRFEDDIFFARAAYVGLTGNFGTVKVGRIAAAHFLSAISFNPYGDSFAFSPMILMSYGGGGLYGDTGWSDSLAYTTPTLGGFTSTLAYAFGEEQGDNSTNKWGANTFYQAGDFGFTAAVQNISGSQTGAVGLGPDDSQLTSLAGVSYAIGDSTIFAQYQLMQDDLEGEDIDRDTLVLSAAIAAGPGSLYLGYGFTRASSGGSDTERNVYSAIYNLPLSPDADLYAGGASDDPDGVEQQGHTLGIGGRYRF